MATYLTFDLTTNSKAVVMKTNDLILSPDINYKSVTVLIENITYISQEENNSDGVNVILNNGTRYTILPSSVTRVGAVDKSPGVYTDSEELKNDIISLMAL